MRLKKKDIQNIIEEYKNKTKKDCYKILLGHEEPQILDDKLGGTAYLPVGETYPTDKNGRPMPLLLQVNLKNINLKGFQNEGILEVFTNIEYPMEYCVRLYKEGLEYQTDLPKTKAFYNNEEFDYFIKKPISITYEKDFMHMPLSNYKSFKTFKEIVKQKLENSYTKEDVEAFLNNNDKLRELWYEIGNEIVYHSLYIGGYPNFTQEDIRPNLKPKKNECVFSLDCVGSEEFIEIGDSGIIWGLISKKDLKNKLFENMFVDYDFC